MKTLIQTTGLLAVIALPAFSLGCSPAPATTTPSSEQQAADTAPPKRGATPSSAQPTEKTGEAKTSAPVRVTFTSSAKSGKVVLTLRTEALADIPRVVSRIVLPRAGEKHAQGGINRIEGELQVDFGAMPRGEVREHQMTVDVPQSARSKIFAGVDCHITSGIQLHKEAQPILLGE